MRPTLPPPYTKSIFLSTWRMDETSTRMRSTAAVCFILGSWKWLISCSCSGQKKRKERRKYAKSWKFSKSITSFFPRSMAASLKQVLLPDLLPQKTQILLNLPPLLPLSTAFCSFPSIPWRMGEGERERKNRIKLQKKTTLKKIIKREMDSSNPFSKSSHLSSLCVLQSQRTSTWCVRGHTRMNPSSLSSPFIPNSLSLSLWIW